MSKERTLNDFYKTFVVNNIPKKIKKQSEVINLYERPIKDKGKQNPFYTTGGPNDVYQADVLYLPEDSITKDKYALVVTDVYSRITDAVPMKDRTAEDVVIAFKKMFKRKILSQPKYLMQTDSGSEFNSVKTKAYFDEIGIGYRFGKPGRSRQQALVEAKNKIIAKALFMRMTANELHTGEKDTDWVEFLSDLIKELNKLDKKKKPKKESNIPIMGPKTILLEVGQHVRLMLDKPRDITIGKLNGNFRATDIRWGPQILEIHNVILTPGQPPMYQVSGDVKRAYTFNQLQLVDDNQEKKEEFSGAKYTVEKILNRRKKGRTTEYLVKWKGYDKEDDNRWIKEAHLKVQTGLHKMIDDFNK